MNATRASERSADARRPRVTAADLVSALGLEVFAGAGHLDNTVTGGYASDLLSCVLAGAGQGSVWVTLQSHINVIAVATLLGLSCVIITEGNRPDAETQSRAEEGEVPILLTTEGTFATVGRLVQMGIGTTR